MSGLAPKKVQKSCATPSLEEPSDDGLTFF